jgi:hypothetical protein
MTGPTYDHAEEVINGPEIYSGIALELRTRGSALLGWTDGLGSHHELLFTLAPRAFGRSNLGLHGPDCLFVSVMRIGAFGFKVPSPTPRHASYVAEKLFGEEHPDETSTALTDLVNGVVAALADGETS